MGRWIGRKLTLAIIIVAVMMGLGILVPRPFLVPVTSGADRGEGRIVLVLSSAIHTDLAFPNDADVRETFGFLADAGIDPAMGGVEWIVAGWGGRAFYLNTPTWADLKPGPVLSALTLDRSVMHVELAGSIDPGRANVRIVELSEARFQALLEAVRESFSRDRDGDVVEIEGAGYGEFDRFYEARGWFNVFGGCNTWTARMLRVAGLKTGTWTILPAFLDLSLDLHN